MSRHSSSWPNWLAHYSALIGAWAQGNSRPQDAEDAVQDAAEKFITGDTTAVRDTRAYLHRSATNGVISRHRRAQSASTHALHELAEFDHPVVDDVETAAYVGQLTKALAASLERLPVLTQHVFSLHRLENWTVPEIATHLNVSTSTIEKHLTRAMRHLHHDLQRFAS